MGDLCWFLAIDFDGTEWVDDVSAFLETCHTLKVPAALERSRSGNGGHVWIFFCEPIQASLARQLGSAILTKTMEKRHQIGLKSYDRLFPNQDTMPKGGFGNLIALPLQKAPREKGNSVFLATGRYIGEGFDDARLDTLFLALPISWKGTIQQYAGRLHRQYDGKKEVRIYDYLDESLPVLARMYKRRLRGYESIGYEIIELDSAHNKKTQGQTSYPCNKGGRRS